jgi:ankyrin repeat protein
MLRGNWWSRSCLKRRTECESIIPGALIGPLIFFTLRFRWVFCQLEVLRHCLPASIRDTLNQLPISLDDTYLRVLSQIPQANQSHAHRMLQCLVVAVRPLRVEELAELLAFEFDMAQGGIPKYRPALRLDDQTQAVLSTCSSLVTIINEHGSGRQVVQFSHFSVKEFLVSNRLASFLGDISRYHIRLGSAHTILTQACLGLLLHLDDHITEERVEQSPLAHYAAEHWVEHAQFEDVASRVKDGMETLFDPDKPHFKAWVGISDIDTGVSFRDISEDASPLYYSVLCGFYSLVDHLAIKHPHHVNAFGGKYEFTLIAALDQGHFEVAELLLERGADVNVREATGKTLLLVALSLAARNLPDIVAFLLTHGADVNDRDDTFASPLHLTAEYGNDEEATILLNRKADVNSQDKNGRTPLHTVLFTEIEMYDLDYSSPVWLLSEHGADVNIRDVNNETPLLLALRAYSPESALILLEHGADASAENNDGQAPLHILSESDIEDGGDILNLVLLLLELGAAMNSRDVDKDTPLHLAILRNRLELSEILLEHGADARAENNNGQTPLHILSESDNIKDGGDIFNLVPLLLKHGAAMNSRDKYGNTPLHLAIIRNRLELTEILLEHGADAGAENNNGQTPLHILPESDITDWGNILNLVLLLLKRGAEVNSLNKKGKTPLHGAIQHSRFKLAEILLEHGADAGAENNNGQTPLHILSESDINDGDDILNPVLLLLKHGVAVNDRNKDHETALHLAIRGNRFKLAGILLEHGADAHAENKNGQTPLCILSESWSHNNGDFVNHAKLFLVYAMGVVNLQDEDNKTSLLVGIGERKYGFTEITTDLSADTSVENNLGDAIEGDIAVRQASRRNSGSREPERSLGLALESGSDPNVQEDIQMMLTYLQSNPGPFQIAILLLYYDANHNIGNNGGKPPIYQEIKGEYYIRQYHTTFNEF